MSETAKPDLRKELHCYKPDLCRTEAVMKGTFTPTSNRAKAPCAEAVNLNHYIVSIGAIMGWNILWRTRSVEPGKARSMKGSFYPEIRSRGVKVKVREGDVKVKGGGDLEVEGGDVEGESQVWVCGRGRAEVKTRRVNPLLQRQTKLMSPGQTNIS